MEENTNLTVDAGADQANDGADVATDTDTNVSMSKADFEAALQKATQSGEDRVRSKLSKEIKELKAKLPVEKTDAEIELENKLAGIEAKQLEMEAKEKELAVRAALQEANIDKSIADYVKPDIDVSALCAVIDKVVNARVAGLGYVPANGHESNKGLTKEQFNKMGYQEMVGLMKENPNLVKQFL